jgi:hypothetical protein
MSTPRPGGTGSKPDLRRAFATASRGVTWDLARRLEAVAAHPEELAVLAAELGWDLCRFSRAAGWADGELDVVFLPPGHAARDG